jgi:hypothetical protein
MKAAALSGVPATFGRNTECKHSILDLRLIEIIRNFLVEPIDDLAAGAG